MRPGQWRSFVVCVRSEITLFVVRERESMRWSRRGDGGRDCPLPHHSAFPPFLGARRPYSETHIPSLDARITEDNKKAPVPVFRRP